MSYTTNANQYREMAVLSASPAQLLTMLYDHLLVTLRRARIAMEAGSIERRGEYLGKCQDVIAELLVTLDHERGGEIASRLSGLYVFFIRELFELGRTNDVARLDSVTALVGELREAFVQAAAIAAGHQGSP
jgi:flagellar protein FliS